MLPVKLLCSASVSESDLRVVIGSQPPRSLFGQLSEVIESSSINLSIIHSILRDCLKAAVHLHVYLPATL